MAPMADTFNVVSPRRILIVDDNRDAATSLALLLELSGHDVHTAYDGLQALEAAARLLPDVVFLDIGLPGLTGYQIAARMRTQAWGRDLQLAALTGWGNVEDREESKRAGFDAHFVKPVNLDDVMAFIRDSPRVAR